MTKTSFVEVDRGGSIATIRFDRPDKLNAVTLDFLREFRDVLTDLTESPEKGLLIAGNGQATCAGMDTDIVSDEQYREKYGDTIDELNSDVYKLLRTYPAPTVMAAHGAVIGEGFMFSLYCDFVVLGEETNFALPEIKYGISIAHSLSVLEGIVGTRAAREIALTGEPILPQRAHTLGLVNDVVPEDDVEDTARGLVEQIAEYDIEVVRGLKAASRIDDER